MDLFYVREHQIICEAILDTWKQKQSLDVVSVCDTLSRQGRLADVGGAAYLSTLIDLPSANLALNDKVIDYLENFRLQRVGLSIRNLPLQPDGLLDLECIKEMVVGAKRFFKPPVISMREALKSALLEIDAGEAQVVRVGIKSFDQGVALRRGDVMILSARTSVGKTVAGCALATGVAMHGGGALIHTMEMSASRIAKRQLANATEIENLKIQRGFLTDDEKTRLATATLTLAGLPIWFRHDAGTWAQHLASYEYALAEHPEISLLVLDYVQLVGGIKADRRDLEIAKVTGDLKQFAVRHNIGVVALSQLNRKAVGDGQSPGLEHLREGGSQEQDADVVMILEAPEAKEREEQGIVGPELLLGHIKKHRDGRLGILEFTYDRRYCRILDRDDIPFE